MAIDSTRVLFTTSRESERVQLEGTATLTTNGSGNGSVTVDHNLGTPYQFIVHNQTTGVTAPSFYIDGNFYARNSADTLTVVISGGAASTANTIAYKILYATI